MGKQGERIDVFLAGQSVCPMSRSKAQQLIKNQKVLVNDAPIKTSYLLGETDIITVHMPEKKPFILEKQNMALDILYEDAFILVLNKEAGQVVHPGAGNEKNTLVNGLLYHTNLSSIGLPERPGIVHRLDKETGGLMVVAKDDSSHEFLATEFSLRRPKREYAAFVLGKMKDMKGEIIAPIIRHPKNRKQMTVAKEETTDKIEKEINAGRYAKSYFRVESFHHHFTYVTVGLVTGRTHQIRVHMAYIHHPILGDDVYGPKKMPHKIPHQALYSKTLGFVHPKTKEYMEFSHALPSYMEDLLSIPE